MQLYAVNFIPLLGSL